MTTHDHSKYMPGCFRCDLSREEVRQAIREDLEPFSDSDLLAELVRRGVLRGEESLVDLKCGGRQPVNPLPSVVMCCSGEYVTQRRYVTEWEPTEEDT